MMSEDLNDNFPVRENGRNPVITRDVNEDRFLKVSEENLTLKKHLRKQEDRIRQLATKLVRVIGEKSKRSERDDILIGDQKSRIEELEAQVSNLKGKLSVARQQLGSCTKLVPGAPKPGRPKSSRSVTGTPTVVPDEVTRLLIDAKGENHLLRDQVKHLQERWNKTNQELMVLKEQLEQKDVEHQDELAAIQSQGQLESDLKQKKLADNIQFIRLQRESKRTASWLATYEAQCRTLEASLNSAKENIGQLELQLATAQEDLRSEQSKCLTLLKQNEEIGSMVQQLKEANAQIDALKDENTILKEANESFLAKSLENCERTQAIDKKEAELNSRIDQLETTVKNEQKAKSDLISALTQEKAKSLSLDQALQILDKKCVTLSSQLTSTTEELFRIKESAENSPREIVVEKEFVTKHCESCPVKDSELTELKERVTQLKIEVSKLKELLKTQVGINKEYQEEIEALTTQMAASEALHEKERRELMFVFSDKANKMAELEQSLETLRNRIPSILTGDTPLSSSKPPVALDDASNPPPPIAHASNLPPPTADSSNPLAPLVDYESSRDLEIDDQLDETKQEFDAEGVVDQIPEDLDPVDAFQKPEIFNPDEGADAPKLKIEIQQLVPIDKEILPRLFVTWEHESLPRQYSPIVSDGNFNSKSVHLISDSFRSTSLDVQLHQAIGESDSRVIGFGKMNPGLIQFTGIRNIENESEEIGTLFYSYVFQNFEEQDLIDVKPPQFVPLPPPVPIPRKFKTPGAKVDGTGIGQPVVEPSDVSEPEKTVTAQIHTLPEVQESSSESLDRNLGKRKSILRREPTREFAKSGKRRVRVSDKIEERKFDSDSECQISMESEAGQVSDDNSFSIGQVLTKKSIALPEPLFSIGQVPEPPKRTVPTPELQQQDSEVSLKRRSRRMSKQTATEESDEVSSSLSVGSEGETSRNISDIETISEEPYGDCDMTIEILYAKFTSHTRLLSDPQVKKFFVEYQLLNYSAEDLETETCQKPPLGRKANFNFKKTFLIETKERRSLLREMISSRKKLQFTLVTEPSDNDTIDCEDIGFAYVSLTDILNSGNDISRKEIPIFNSENLNNEIGVLCVSVLAFKVLNTL